MKNKIIKMVFAIVLIFAVLIFQINFEGVVGSEAAALETDSGETISTDIEEEFKETSKALGAPEVLKTSEALETSKDLENPEALKNSEAPETQESPESLEASETPEAPKDLKTPEETGTEEIRAEEVSSGPSISTFGSGPSGSPLDAPSYGQISLVTFKQLANGCMGGIVLDTSGRVWTFGYNLYGTLGVGKTVTQQMYYGGMKRIPYFIDNGINIIEIGATYQTRYALSDEGKVYAWGYGNYGAMGNGTTVETNIKPTEVSGLPAIEHLFTCDAYQVFPGTFALARDGTLWAWGRNSGPASGRFGFGTTSDQLSPRQVPLDSEFTAGTRKIVKVSSGITSSHLLDDQGDLWVTGSDSVGQQGNGGGVSPNLTTFQKMNRSLTGMGKVIDVDTSYSDLIPYFDRVLAADENADVWEWGRTFGDAASGVPVNKQTPQKIVLDPSEVAAVGYTPVPVSVHASEMVGYFIDQHGRPWGWGNGYYFGFAREGGYSAAGGSNTQVIRSTAAQQVPKIMGDGDTQINNSSAKIPVYKGGTLIAGGGENVDGTNGRLGYGILATHPTIYDEKYMLKDKDGNVLDTEGNTIKKATDVNQDNINGLTRGKYYRKGPDGMFISLRDTEGNLIKKATATTMDGVSGLTIGRWYRVDSGGKIISPAVQGTPVALEGMPAVDPIEALWINLAFKEVPYIKYMDISRSAYAFLDTDGNLYKWGNDGSGAVAWGWDASEKYDEGPRAGGNNIMTNGLYDRYLYEVMYMRGAPNIEHVGLSGEISRKVYKSAEETVDNKVQITLRIPKTVVSAEVEADVKSDISELKYVFIPYDGADPNFKLDVSTLSYEEFMEIYDTASVKGDVIDTPISSSSEVQNIVKTVNAPENGRIIVFGRNNRYVLDSNGTHEYENVSTLATSVIVDNVYTRITMKHKGVGQHDGESDVDLYDPTTDNVVKMNDDSADTKQPFDTSLYGLPLDAKGNVLGTSVDIGGEITVVQAPRYGYDKVEIKSYEAVGDAGLPSGIKPYWKFKEYLDAGKTQLQPKTVDLELIDADYKIKTVVNPETGDEEKVYYAYGFLYEKDLDYWTYVNGSKTWDDMEDTFAFRPDKITLTLKQYKRDPTTGAKGDFIKDIISVTVTPDKNDKWLFDFGTQMSYEYTYEVVETAIANYETEIVYTNLSRGAGSKNEDFSKISIANTLVLHPLKFNKVDESEELITSDTAVFTMTNSDENGKVLDASGSEVSSLEFTTGTVGFISIPFQKAGTYKITETKAPESYKLLDRDILLIIGADASVTVKMGDTELAKRALTAGETGKFSFAYNIVNEDNMTFAFTKVKAEDETIPLADAQFKLYSWEGLGTVPDIVEDSAIDDDKWKLVDTQTSGGDGKISFEALGETVYQLVETKAPLGYSRPAGQWRITLNASGEWEIIGKGNMLPPAFLKDGEGNLAVTNMKNNLFPLTGFGGIAGYLLAGISLMILTVVFFLFSKKRRININKLITAKGGRERKD